MFETLLTELVDFIDALGYIGIFIMTALESTFFPLPSELTMIPVGYLIHQGRMDFGLAFTMSILGTIAGSLANYALAYYLGRPLLIKYGKYMFMNEEKMHKVDEFFVKYGAASIFLGRLVMGVRHFISFPAGLAKMDLKKFCIYTTVGGGLWMAVLLGIGYLIGDNQDKIHIILPAIKGGLFVIVALTTYIIYRKNRKPGADKKG